MKIKTKNRNFFIKGLFFVSLFFWFFSFLISVQAADFEINIQGVEWKINNGGIYRNSYKIDCNRIRTASMPSPINKNFLVKSMDGTKIMLITKNYIYVTAKSDFSSLIYPGSITNSFILKDDSNNVLLYANKNDGFKYHENMCVVSVGGETCGDGIIGNNENCGEPGLESCSSQYGQYFECSDSCQCYLDMSCSTNSKCEDILGVDGYCAEDCYCSTWNEWGYVPDDELIYGDNSCESYFGVDGYCAFRSSAWTSVWWGDCTPPFNSAQYYCSKNTCMCVNNNQGLPKPTNACTNGGGTCLTGNTRVDTLNGYKYIKDVQVGDMVYSYDLEKDQVVESKVEKKFKHEQSNDKLMLIALSNGKEIEITDNHPTYSVLEGRFKEVKDFKLGEWVSYYNNESKEMEIALLTAIQEIELKEVVYSLHLSGNINNHTANGMIVHNATDTGGKVDPNPPGQDEF